MPPSRQSQPEFVALMAMMFAIIAFSIDAMLPALPEIGRALTPEDVNRAQLVVTVFVLGMGVGTFFTGPLSDALGRKPVIYGGFALYIVTAGIAAVATSLEMLLVARFLQGLGAAAPRIVAVAIVRDLYAGRRMAQIMSFVMMVFTLVPAVAPLIGAGMIALAGWRAIFVAFMLFGLVAPIWMALRLEEPLPREMRRPFRMHALTTAAAEIAMNPMVRLSILVQALVFGQMFSMLVSVQPVFDVTFGRAESFPLWFGVVAVIAGSATLLNALLVMRLGMRFLITVALAAQCVLSGAMIAIILAAPPDPLFFALFVIWQTSLFFQVGLTVGNINAMAMEPLGHIAGFASSIIGGLSTVLAVMLAIPVGLMFDGTPLPLATGVFVMGVAALVLMLRLRMIEGRAAARA
ncbi:multidrug effflux MFS transporter [Rhodosalinus sp.]|uniref:multidrug effflux MFS transporter n=1 Tax=Rhodosalinus sp. TaxID=2047741 RepID=UPI00397815FD